MQFEITTKTSPNRLRTTITRTVLASLALSATIIHGEKAPEVAVKSYEEFVASASEVVYFGYGLNTELRSIQIDPDYDPIETITNVTEEDISPLDRYLFKTAELYEKLKQSPEDYIVFSAETDFCLPGNMVPENWRQLLSIRDQGDELVFRPVSYLDDGEEVIVCGFHYPEPPKIRGDRIPLAITRMQNIVEHVDLIPCEDYLLSTGDEALDFEISASIPVNACVVTSKSEA